MPNAHAAGYIILCQLPGHPDLNQGLHDPMEISNLCHTAAIEWRIKRIRTVAEYGSKLRQSVIG
jgi:hypothetical protein